MTFVKKNIETHFAYICWHFNNARNKTYKKLLVLYQEKEIKEKNYTCIYVHYSSYAFNLREVGPPKFKIIYRLSLFSLVAI